MSDEDRREQGALRDARGDEVKAPYAKPRLTRFGHLEELTQGGTGGAGDGVSSMGKKKNG